MPVISSTSSLVLDIFIISQMRKYSYGNVDYVRIACNIEFVTKTTVAATPPPPPQNQGVPILVPYHLNPLQYIGKGYTLSLRRVLVNIGN